MDQNLFKYISAPSGDELRVAFSQEALNFEKKQVMIGEMRQKKAYFLQIQADRINIDR